MTTPAIDHLAALAALPAGALSEAGRRLARFSLFDWIVVARGGAGEPLAAMIRDYVVDEAGRGVATVVGAAQRVPARAAALANGTISHALDYDDTHFAHVGHLSVGVMPAALAVGEEVEAEADEVLDAFLVGAEAAIRVGLSLGRGHYLKGFHQTATAGAFGATVAAARLYGLSPAQVRNAISLVATRASGLKSQFGTMGKPYNAGIAASNGVEAAALAARGFVSADDGLDGPQGFHETHADTPPDPGAWADPPPERFIFEDNKYKLHACCHGTHAMIEALLSARRARNFAPYTVERIDVQVNPRWLKVCDIKAPRTGLEVKFSYAFLAGMVMNDISTAADVSYRDALCSDPALKQVAERVVVRGDDALSDTDTHAEIVFADGERVATRHDLADPMPPAELEAGLLAKARALLGAQLADRIYADVTGVRHLSARDVANLLNIQ
ncbi:MmgE/PrpD family protein [Acuticoccus mangrovi]|uniref:MmgE/PrpD family protein n=1 Tax=Acuticoccus mangrovi TaxID=2796142 RepID=A0A934IUJ6_9HYPH|nr:MmgE/PrpD family protein [Acuticoccus mangrovi]MBJ3777999.1 MmgE/PrpD family protein [Acuticoccus mangrovi]